MEAKAIAETQREEEQWNHQSQKTKRMVNKHMQTHPPQTRKFDGKRYRFGASWGHKENALNDAMELRKIGYKVRTVKRGAIWINYILGGGRKRRLSGAAFSKVYKP